MMKPKPHIIHPVFPLKHRTRDEIVYGSKYPKFPQDWVDNRAAYLMQTGYVKCSYVDIWLPDQSGKMCKIWTFTGSFMEDGYDCPVLYDYPLVEIDWRSGDNPLCRMSRNTYIDSTNFLNPRVWHVGILTLQAIEHIVKKTDAKGSVVDLLVNTDGVVLYNPYSMVWEAGESWKSQKKKSSAGSDLSAILAAMAATIIS